jgi:hypothetical protein
MSKKDEAKPGAVHAGVQAGALPEVLRRPDEV